MCLFIQRFVILFAICGVSVAAEIHRFQPEGCEFSAVLFKKPEYRYSWRGESLITVAEVQQSRGTTMRASCGSFYIVDHAAFQANLDAQMRRAARMAGLKQFKVSIQKNGLGTVASFWGMRGEGELQTFYRSDTYVGKRSFLELVVHTVPENREDLQLSQFQNSVKR